MLAVGESTVVLKIGGKEAVRTRFADLGLVEGSRVSCLMESPLGDPCAYLVCGAVIAIRREDALNIVIEDCSIDRVENRKNRVIALAGNPNVGKSTVFNSLTGMKQHTGNWAGKTVGCAVGSCNVEGDTVKIVDLPGTYSLRASSEEERAASDFICSNAHDLVCVVCDATCLERNLILALQIMSKTPNVLICVNLIDEAERKGIKIDIALLEKLLAVPVVGISARSGEGMNELRKALIRHSGNYDSPETAPRMIENIAEEAASIARSAVSVSRSKRAERDRRLDRIFTGKYTGFPIMLLLFGLIFFITAAGANIPSEWLSGVLFGLGERFRAYLVSAGMPWWLVGALMDGVYRTVAWVVSVMLPPMAIFFPLFTILEDLGYLPRIAFNLDRCFGRCNACGKQALTM